MPSVPSPSRARAIAARHAASSSLVKGFLVEVSVCEPDSISTLSGAAPDWLAQGVSTLQALWQRRRRLPEAHASR